MLCFFGLMRIIAGSAKGHGIRVPECAVVRPSTDRVRSAVFSILEHMNVGWSRALDLFAGSGALGLEALSRGADWADFVDQERRCCAIIKQNSESLGFASCVHIYCGKVSSILPALHGPYGMAFLDPPYADDSLPPVLQRISDLQLLAGNGVAVVLHSSRRALSAQYGRLKSIKERRHGDTMISLYAEEAEL